MPELFLVAAVSSSFASCLESILEWYVMWCWLWSDRYNSTFLPQRAWCWLWYRFAMSRALDKNIDGVVFLMASSRSSSVTLPFPSSFKTLDRILFRNTNGEPSRTLSNISLEFPWKVWATVKPLVENTSETRKTEIMWKIDFMIDCCFGMSFVEFCDLCPKSIAKGEKRSVTFFCWRLHTGLTNVSDFGTCLCTITRNCTWDWLTWVVFTFEVFDDSQRPRYS